MKCPLCGKESLKLIKNEKIIYTSETNKQQKIDLNSHVIEGKAIKEELPYHKKEYSGVIYCTSCDFGTEPDFSIQYMKGSIDDVYTFKQIDFGYEVDFVGDEAYLERVRTEYRLQEEIYFQVMHEYHEYNEDTKYLYCKKHDLDFDTLEDYLNHDRKKSWKDLITKLIKMYNPDTERKKANWEYQANIKPINAKYYDLKRFYTNKDFKVFKNRIVYLRKGSDLNDLITFLKIIED